MKFSILIPCVPARRDNAAILFDELQKQSVGLPVEILALLDNKQRTIGMKREALVQIARGDYLAFVDDDDRVSNLYVRKILAAIETSPDVVVFDTAVSLNGSVASVAHHSLRFENEQYHPVTFKRKPWQMHAWRREIAQAFHFPDTNIGEDWGWCKQLCGAAKTEVQMAGPLYWYRYSDSVTEAH